MDTQTKETIEELIQSEELDRAEQQLVAILKRDANDSSALYLLALVALEKGGVDESAEILDHLVRVDPQHVEGRNDLAVLEHTRGRAEHATSHFIKALETEPTNQTALLNFVEVLLKDQQYAEAVRWIRFCERHEGAAEAGDDGLDEIGPCGDPFLRAVPDALRAKKVGLKVVIYAENDSDGRSAALCQAINLYTTHKARVIYGNVPFVRSHAELVCSLDAAHRDEAMALIEDAQFFEILDGGQDTETMRWSQWVNENNALIASRPVARVPATSLTYNPRAIPAAQPVSDKIVLCHLPDVDQNPLLADVCERLERRYPGRLQRQRLDADSHGAQQAMKSLCHITYEGMAGGYGVSAIESMAAGHVVLASLTNDWVCQFPGNPVLSVSAETLEMQLEDLIQHPEKIVRLGEASRRWARQTHHPRVVAKQRAAAYDLVRHGCRAVRGSNHGLIR